MNILETAKHVEALVQSGRPAIANQVLLFIKRVYRLATKYGAVVVNIA